MASDWIKMRTDLYRDPKVSVIADCLLEEDGELSRYINQNCQRDMTVTRNVMRNVTVGALVSVWGVMRHRGKRLETDLVCVGVTPSVVDDIADLPGFGDAMLACGWLVETDQGIVFPRFFEDFNVAIEGKNVSPAAERQRRYREKKKAESDAIGDVTRDVTVTPREEKSREENIENTFVASMLDDMKLPACPHEKVIALYADALPMLPFPRVWEGQRQEMLRARWKFVLTSKSPSGEPYATDTDSALVFFRRFFAYVAKCPHLIGQNDRGWTADLAWLVKAENFAKVLEGKYEPKKVAA